MPFFSRTFALSRTMSRARVLLAAFLVMGAACGDDDATPVDGGGFDAPAIDTGGGPMVSAQILDYLRGDRASSLTVEVDYVAGTEITSEAQAHFVARLGTVLDKPGGVTVQLDEVIPSHADTPWELEELRTLAAERQTLDGGADGTVLHLMFVDGRFTIRGVLGAALSATSIVIFRETIDQVCDSPSVLPLQRASVCGAIEATVLLHETGHVIGLVNRGLPMVEDHEDPERRGHEATEGCLMYFALEDAGDFALDGFLGGDPEPIDFCAGSMADIQAQQ